MAQPYRSNRRAPKLQLTPLIDVVFILLIFFMLTASPRIKGVQVDLPQAQAASSVELSPVVTVTAEGEVQLDGTPILLDDLAEILGPRLVDDNRVIVRADESIALGRAVEVLDEVTAAGGKPALAAKRKSTPPTTP